MPKITPQNLKHPSASATSQRGVYAIFFVLLLTTIIAVVVMLGMEVNRIYSEHRALQNQANAAAIAAANATQACGSLDSQGESLSPSDATANAIALNAAESAGFVKDDNSSITSFLGYLETGDSNLLEFHKTAASRSNAAHVVLSRETQFSRMFPKWLLNNTFTMTAQGTARKELTATLSGAATTADIGGDTDQANLLNTLLGTILLGGGRFSLSPTDFQDLTETLVNVGDLLDTLGISNVTDLVNPSEVTAIALVEALKTTYGAVAPAGELLDGLLGNAGLETLQVGDVLSIVGDTQVNRDARFPLYDIIMALTLDLANHALFELPDTSLDIPGITSVGVKLFVGQPPKIAIGPALKDETGWVTKFYAADISLQLDANLNVGAAGLNLTELDLRLAVSTGGGSGEFVSAYCRTGSNDNTAVLRVDAEADVARVATGTINPTTGTVNHQPLKVAVLSLFGLDVLGVKVNLDVPIAAAPKQPLIFEYDLHGGEPVTVSLGGGIQDLDTDLDVEPEVLGVCIPGICQITKGLIGTALKPLVKGLVGLLGQAVLTPLLQGLGLDLGKLDITLVDVQQAPVVLVPGKIECVNC